MDKQRFLAKLYQVMADGTQKELARRLGISQCTLSRLRSGQRAPGWRLIRSLLRAYPDVTLADWGLDEREESPPPKP